MQILGLITPYSSLTYPYHKTDIFTFISWIFMGFHVGKYIYIYII